MTPKTHEPFAARTLGLTLGAVAAGALGIAIAAPAGAAQPPAEVSGDVLTVNGTHAPERLALRLQAGIPGVLEVDFGDDGTAEASFDRATFSRIHVLLRGGDDQFRMDQTNGTFADEVATIDAGAGDDDLAGGDGAELFFGRSGNDSVDGNRGDDTGWLGSGTDSFRWDPGDGSDVVEGETGTDTLDFNGAGAPENMSLSANGQRSLFLRDVATIRMDMDDVERLDLTALGGPDTMLVGDMTGTDFQRADIDLSGPAGGGDGQIDRVTVDGTAAADVLRVKTKDARVDVVGLQTEVRVVGSETTDLLQVKTFDGDDQVVVDDDVAAIITPSVDLGPGQS